MVIVDITDVKPFDVLLTSGDAKISHVNRKMQSITREGAESPYSHASMFLSPFLIVESLDQPGIVLSSLFKPAQNPHGSQGDGENLGVHIFVRTENHKARMFAALPGVDAARILRYKPINDLGTMQLLILFKKVIDGIADVYLAQYPAYIRLARTAGLLPPRLIDSLETVGRRLEKKEITGPFCSELVAILLETIKPGFLSPQVVAASISPSDFYNDCSHFETIATQENYAALDKLPGIEMSGVATFLEDSLSLSSLYSQVFNSELIMLTASLTKNLSKTHSLDRTQEALLDEYYSNVRRNIRNRAFSDVENIMEDAFSVMLWLQRANKCLISCPENRPARDGGSDTINPEIKISPPRVSFAWEHNGLKTEPCEDARYCSTARPSWLNIKDRLERNRELRLSRSVERASALAKNLM